MEGIANPLSLCHPILICWNARGEARSHCQIS